ncbi:PIN domain nuclease [Chromatium weissei]|nr:PIN domain nuclease [Chromatium weissei]
MKILFDTNVILDVLIEREPFVTAAVALFSLVETRKIQGYLGATTLTTLDYLLTKTNGCNSAKASIKALLQLFEVCPVDSTVLIQAVESNFSDFEDAVLYFAGENMGVDGLVTRNIEDFSLARYTVYLPNQLLDRLEMKIEK